MSRKEWSKKAKAAGFSMKWNTEWEEWEVRSNGGEYFDADPQSAYDTGLAMLNSLPA